MKPYYEDEHATIYCGDCREVLPYIDGVDVVLTDPPYGLSFMGSGSTLVAAREHGGQKAIGIDKDEHNCEIAANRLAQGTLF